MSSNSTPKIIVVSTICLLFLVTVPYVVVQMSHGPAHYKPAWQEAYEHCISRIQSGNEKECIKVVEQTTDKPGGRAIK